MTQTPSALSIPRTPRPQPALLIALAIALATAAVPAGYRYAYSSKIYPGVFVSQVHLGGQRPAEALAALESVGLDPSAPVEFQTGDESWHLTPAEAGVAFDARATVERAYSLGRIGSTAATLMVPLRARLTGMPISPVITVDQAAAEQAIHALADAYDRPAIDAGFRVEGTRVVEAEAVPGRTLNVGAALEALLGAAGSDKWPLTVNVPVQAVAPVVTDASPALAHAEALLAQPVTLVAEGGEWQLDPEALAGMLVPRATGTTVELDIDPVRLQEWMAPIAATLERPAANPRYTFDEATGRLVAKDPGQVGRQIDTEATSERILATAGAASRRAQVAEVPRPPDLPDSLLASELGIEGLVHSETSFFSGSPAARIHNIGLSAARFDGVLIPPDAIFSFNEQVGEINAEGGYKETLIIMDGTTAEGVGGGVCQVSTTLFRAAFWAGLPIVERSAHGYRVAYYEQGNIEPGLDATIYRPVVDLKVHNDTGAWLLIETSTNPQRATVTFSVYGKDLGRSVEMEGPVVSAVVPPPAGRVEVDPSLAPGATRTLEHARSGAHVSLVRVVRTGDEEVRDRFVSNYRPTGQVVAVGPEPAAEAAVEAPIVP